MEEIRILQKDHEKFAKFYYKAISCFKKFFERGSGGRC